MNDSQSYAFLWGQQDQYLAVSWKTGGFVWWRHASSELALSVYFLLQPNNLQARHLSRGSSMSLFTVCIGFGAEGALPNFT